MAKVLRKMIVAHSGGVLPTVSVKKAEETPVGEAGVFITYPRAFNCGAHKRVILRTDLPCHPQAAVEQQVCLNGVFENKQLPVCACSSQPPRTCSAVQQTMR